MRSRIGRAFVAIRDQDIAAEIIGINIYRYKLLSFAISSFYAGVCGVLYTYYLGIANYEQFQIGVSIDYLAMIIIGGLGSVLGSILGAVFVTMLPIVLRLAMEPLAGLFFSPGEMSSVIASTRLVLFGGLIIFFLVVEPEGSEPAVAQHPQLLPRLAVFILSDCNEKPEEEAMKHTRRWLGAAFAAGAVALAAGVAFAQEKELVFGLQCDRTGATQNVGVFLCPGYHDYIALLNSKGGIEGYKIRVIEIDNEYKVPPAMEAHERFKKEGAVLESLYGTPQTAALTKKLEEDKILGTSPGFGTAAASDGKKYPYVFPIAASYWSQGAAAVAFAKKELGGNLKGKKIAYLFYDNPAGKEPLVILEDLAKSEGFEMRTFAVPAPGVEMGAQVLDITGRFKPDFVIAHLFGRSPSVSIKELKGKGYPMSKVISLVWGASEADIKAAGGYAVAEGYHTIQFAGVGADFQVIKDINAMYKAQGKPAPSAQEVSVYYNRGVMIAAIHAEAARNAIKAKGGAKPTSEDVKKGMEAIKGFTLGGMVPPMEITEADHEGGGWVQVWTVKGGKLVKNGDWFQAYRDVINKHLVATN